MKRIVFRLLSVGAIFLATVTFVDTQVARLLDELDPLKLAESVSAK
jgi:hypothetical protein